MFVAKHAIQYYKERWGLGLQKKFQHNTNFHQSGNGSQL